MADLKRSMFLHVMPKEKFTYGFVEFTFATVPDVDVRFVVYGDDGAQGYEPYVDERVVPVPSAKAVFRSEESLKLLHESDVVIFNWVNMSMLPSMWRYLPKTHLLFWGGDFSPYVAGKRQGLAYRLKRLLLAASIRRARGVIGIVQSDLEKIASIGGQVGTQSVCEIAYLPSRNAGFVPAVKHRSLSVNVLLGNSATPTNRHRSAIDALARFAAEDIRVYAPLSYGDDDYRAEVIEHGCEVLGDKFIPVTDFMERAEYIAFLNKMDIGVFNCDRQQGLGNIQLLLHMGAKVYLSRDGGMLADLRADGAVVDCFEDIGHGSFKAFCAPLDDASIARNKALFSFEGIYERAKGHWGAFYRSFGVGGGAE
ncbi:MAG: TDP-N-acetylfucosamine:lipid II N-acetylfucosaminyltransferase [Eggerthellaceae bacterium]|nr:TDP-N-acetylfucosamine:lipid II N-acetylfucosaminyltransferase [Eggerthellaceae bacterium]